MYFWICVRKCLESVLVPETNERNGSGGGTYGVNLILSLVQHNPKFSFQYISICLTTWAHNVHRSNNNGLVCTVINLSRCNTARWVFNATFVCLLTRFFKFIVTRLVFIDRWRMHYIYLHFLSLLVYVLNGFVIIDSVQFRFALFVLLRSTIILKIRLVCNIQSSVTQIAPSYCRHRNAIRSCRSNLILSIAST